MKYVAVTDSGVDNAIEIPLECDDTLLLSTLTAQFPSASGLKYKPVDSKFFRGLRCDDMRIYSPEEGWDCDEPMVVVYPKENTKRKNDDMRDEEYASSKSKKFDEKKCMDLIILGLPYATTSAELREYFGQFGELVVADVKTDQNGSSKGYGFVRFAEYESQAEVLLKRHKIGERWCDCKIPNSQLKETSSNCRVFVGRVPEAMGLPEVRAGFEEFGPVTDVYIPTPHRGFAFVTFAHASTASQLTDQDVIINGHSLHVGPAAPKSEANQEARRQRGGGAGGGYGDEFGFGRGGGAYGLGGGRSGTRGGGGMMGAHGTGMGAGSWGMPQVPAYESAARSWYTNAGNSYY